MALKNLDEYNKEFIEKFKRERKCYNGLACPQCGEELRDREPGMFLASNPAQSIVICDGCGFTGKRYV